MSLSLSYPLPLGCHLQTLLLGTPTWPQTVQSVPSLRPPSQACGFNPFSQQTRTFLLLPELGTVFPHKLACFWVFLLLRSMAESEDNEDQGLGTLTFGALSHCLSVCVTTKTQIQPCVCVLCCSRPSAFMFIIFLSPSGLNFFICEMGINIYSSFILHV